MRISCPDCDALYEVPTVRLPLDKKVRCAQCGAEWRVAPPGGPAEAGTGATRADGLRRSIGGGASRRDEVPWGPRLGWVLSILLLVMTGTAIFVWRADIVRIWPPSSRIPAMMASPVESESK